MSKNQQKEKSSFWKILGLGKSKKSVTSLNSEVHRQQEDVISIKSKRASTIYASPPQNQHSSPPTPKPMTCKNYKKTGLLQKTKEMPTFEVDISHHHGDIQMPTTAAAHLHKQHRNESLEESEQNDMRTIINSSQQPNVTPKQYQESDDKSMSSFVVLDKKSSNDELMAVVSTLKQQLEQEKATVVALQKQKEAVAKDLDYLELTVDELYTEKTDLSQQLEDEKIKSQHHLDDLNLLLDKMKSTADNARGQSFAVDQTKLEFEAYQAQAEKEKQSLMSEIDAKEKANRELKFKLDKSLQQSETLKETLEQLVKTHAAELSQLQQQENQSHAWPLHTPNGSPRIQPDSHQEEEQHHLYDDQSIYGVSPPSMSSDRYRTPKESVEYLDDNDLDDQLKKLIKEKEELQSRYSKIPLTGGGPKSRYRKEELEALLDHVDSQLSKVKQKIKRS